MTGAIVVNLLIIVCLMSKIEPEIRYVNAQMNSTPAELLNDWLLADRQLDYGQQSNPLHLFDSQASINPVVMTSDNSLNIGDYRQSPCQLVQVVHLLHQLGCQSKAIDSFACIGSCPSYVQVSSSKFWQRERSCSCCQQTGLKEATFTLDCPSLNPPYRKIRTHAPAGCLCRSCTDLGREDLRPQELVEALADEVKHS